MVCYFMLQVLFLQHGVFLTLVLFSVSVVISTEFSYHFIVPDTDTTCQGLIQVFSAACATSQVSTVLLLLEVLLST